MAIIFSPQVGIAQSENEHDLQDSFDQMQEQLQQMMEELNQGEGSAFFFSDTLFNQGFGMHPMNMDSLFQGFSFSIPGSDSLWQRNDPFLGTDIQDQLNQMFKSLDDLDPQYFQGLEDLMREFDKNGIRPDGVEPQPKKEGKRKKKIYKI